MFDHVKFGASDFAASKAFFLKALEPLGVAIAGEGPPAYGVELVRPGNNCSLIIFETQEKPAIIFGRVTYEMMEEAWRAPAPGEPTPRAGVDGNGIDR